MPTKIIKNSGRFKKGQKAWNFGKKATTEAKYNMSKARIGRKFAPLSEEHRRKISEAQKGKALSAECRKKIGDANRNPSLETRKKMSTAKKGNKASAETKLKMSIIRKGRKHTEETRKKMSGSNCHLWRGGVTPLHLRVRGCFEYRQWRSDVFTRDLFACQVCGDNKGGNLNAHHIVPLAVLFQKYEITSYDKAIKCEEIWNVNNGVTLCENCHIDIHLTKEGLS